MNLSGYFTRRRAAEPEVELVEAAPAAVEATHEIVARPRPDRPLVADDPLAPGPVDEVDVHADSAIAMLRAENASLREDAARARFKLKHANHTADQAAHFADQAARAASMAVQRANAAELDRDKARRALDEQRPTIDVEQLAERLQDVYVRSTAASDHQHRWHRVAEAAVDTVRGTWPIEAWPLTPAEAEPQQATPLGASRVGTPTPRPMGPPSDVVVDVDGGPNRPAEPAPTNSPGSGAEAVVPSPAAPSAPGDPTHTGPMPTWPYETSPGGGTVEAPDALPAVAGAPAPGDPNLAARRETLAEALAQSELRYVRRTWPEFSDQIREEYRGMADDVIAAGWRPP